MCSLKYSVCRGIQVVWSSWYIMLLNIDSHCLRKSTLRVFWIPYKGWLVFVGANRYKHAFWVCCSLLFLSFCYFLCSNWGDVCDIYAYLQFSIEPCRTKLNPKLTITMTLNIMIMMNMTMMEKTMVSCFLFSKFHVFLSFWYCLTLIDYCITNSNEG